MAEIGVTLREARMRAGIDISEVEARTKIRAKYLRALENEEWSLLPGPTYVKSFLRTYADALELDSKLLVEEYKFRHEPYESQPGAPGGRPAGPRRGPAGAFGPPRRSPVLPLLVLVGLVVVVVVVVAQLSSNERTKSTRTDAPAPTTTTTRSTGTSSPVRRRISLRISVPSSSAPVYACVRDARDRAVSDGRTIAPGSSSRTFRSSSFEIALSGGSPRVTVRGERVRLKSDGKGVISYRLTRRAPKVLPAGSRPACQT